MTSVNCTTLNRVILRTATLLAAMMLAGCKAKPQSPLPQYPLTDARQTLAAFTARASAVTTVQAEAAIEMTDAKRQTVHLDAALLLQPPDRVRLRAWKFGTAVFDLTVRGDQAWAYVPRDEARPAMPAARQSITQWIGLLQGQVATPQSRVEQTDQSLVVNTPSDGGTLRCTIDRPTLTAQRYELLDDRGVLRFTLSLADYNQFGNAVWAMTITAVSEQGTIVIHATDVTLNGELPPGAFDPPARADRLP